MSKTTQIHYGFITDELCPECNKNDQFKLKKVTTWMTLLFFTLFAKERHYYKQCTHCLSTIEMNGLQAQHIIDKSFAKTEKTATRKTILRHLIPYLVVAAIAFLTYAIIMDSDQAKFKNLLSDREDGYYEIYDEDGHFLAALTKDETCSYDLFIKRDFIYSEEYDDLSNDLIDEYYYYESNGKLEPSVDNAGYLRDHLGVIVQHYFYDTDEKEVFYYFGVDDVNDITYTSSKAVYPMVFFAEDDTKEYYTKVFMTNDMYMVELLFKNAANAGELDMLQTIEVHSLQNGRVGKYDYYDIESAPNANGLISKLTQKDSIENVINALADGILPTSTEIYNYHRDTYIPSSIVTIYTDEQSGNKITTKYLFDIEQKGSYYILKRKEIVNDEPVINV